MPERSGFFYFCSTISNRSSNLQSSAAISLQTISTVKLFLWYSELVLTPDILLNSLSDIFLLLQYSLILFRTSISFMATYYNAKCVPLCKIDVKLFSQISLCSIVTLLSCSDVINFAAFKQQDPEAVMRKYFVFLIVILFITSAAAADRIAPTKDIGLFIDPNLFWKGLQRTPIYNYIYEQETRPYPEKDYYSDNLKYVTEYNIEGDASINCWINKYNKIHAIRIYFEPWYFVRDDSFDECDIARYVLQSAGLLLTDDDYAAIDAIKTLGGWYLARNFYIEKYTDDDELVVAIEPIYFPDPSMDPYKLMEIFSDRVCDPNYIGACIPVANYDLDCSDFSVKNFFAVGTDKHRFDGDGNGVCCEPYPLQ